MSAESIDVVGLFVLELRSQVRQSGENLPLASLTGLVNDPIQPCTVSFCHAFLALQGEHIGKSLTLSHSWPRRKRQWFQELDGSRSRNMFVFSSKVNGLVR
jgi:hypothetical protein